MFWLGDFITFWAVLHKSLTEFFHFQKSTHPTTHGGYITNEMAFAIETGYSEFRVLYTPSSAHTTKGYSVFSEYYSREYVTHYGHYLSIYYPALLRTQSVLLKTGQHPRKGTKNPKCPVERQECGKFSIQLNTK